MAAAPKVSHITAKQRAADVANLKKARAVARRLPRTAKQKNAARQNLVKARAAQKARRSGKKAVVAKKKPQAALDLPGLVKTEIDCNLYLLPACAPVALAAHLEAWTGITVPDEEILDLHELVRPAALGDLLEYAAADGIAGRRLVSFRPCDPGLLVPGLLYGIQLAAGYHAVILTDSGMLSWGSVIPLAGEPEEAWMLEWD